MLKTGGDALVKSTDTERRLMAARGWGKGKQGVTANRYGVSLWNNRMF